ncbi:CapA family protein [Chloroflexota bacterium]
MNPSKLSIYAVGDTKPNRPNSESLFELALPTLKKADILYGQLEYPLSEKGELQQCAYPTRNLKGLSPDKVSVLTYAGFDVMSFAGNNTFARGVEAILETIETLTKNNIQIVGVGKNIDEARKPVILERKGTKVGFLDYASVLPRGYQAEPNKPGCAPMRASTFYEQVDWQAGTPPKIVTLANKDDLAAMVDDIKKVRSKVDVLIMCIHWGVHLIPSVIAMYQKEVAHAAIDAGVDLILGSHPHILKGIEVYKGKVIIYSLGNFILPTDKGDVCIGTILYRGYGVKEYDEYPDYGFPVDARKSMVAKCLISDKKIEKVSYLPVMINEHAQPEVLTRSDKRSTEVFDYMVWCCRDQGLDTKFSWEGDEAIILT